MLGHEHIIRLPIPRSAIDLRVALPVMCNKKDAKAGSEITHHLMVAYLRLRVPTALIRGGKERMFSKLNTSSIRDPVFGHLWKNFLLHKWHQL